MVQSQVELPVGIRKGLKYLTDQSEHAFLKKLKQQYNDRLQSTHTMTELLPGVYCASIGFTAQYEPKMSGQTPDWLFLDTAGLPCFFGDVLNFHINAGIEKEMMEDYQTKGWWGGDLPSNEKRLLPSLMEKAGKYEGLADHGGLPFVIFLYEWFDSFLDATEIEACLSHKEYGLFKAYSHLSGVYHFKAVMLGGFQCRKEGYRFRFYANPDASRPLSLADGIVPLPIPDPPKKNAEAEC